MDLSKQKFFNHSFQDQDLRGVDLSHSQFIICDFTGANLAQCDCTHSDFTGSKLVGTNCNRTNFANSRMACRFEPSDAYGVVFSMDCNTFKGMSISKQWWLCFKMFSLMQEPPKEPDGTDPRDRDIANIGALMYAKLKTMFARREL